MTQQQPVELGNRLRNGWQAIVIGILVSILGTGSGFWLAFGKDMVRKQDLIAFKEDVKTMLENSQYSRDKEGILMRFGRNEEKIQQNQSGMSRLSEDIQQLALSQAQFFGKTETSLATIQSQLIRIIDGHEGETNKNGRKR